MKGLGDMWWLKSAGRVWADLSVSALVAGFVAVHKKMINIRDVYDEKELKAYSPQLNFLKQVDVKTGYRTKQMLVAPVLEAHQASGLAHRRSPVTLTRRPAARRSCPQSGARRPGRRPARRGNAS